MYIKLPPIKLLTVIFIFSFNAHAEIVPRFIDESTVTDSPFIAAAQSVATTFTMRPSVTSTTLGASIEKINLGFACVDRFTGQLVPNTPIKIDSWNPIINSGGHDHDDSVRPKGLFSPAFGMTSGSGFWFISYTSPEVSGVIQAALVCIQPNGQPSPPLIFTIGVRISDLQELIAGNSFSLVGSFGQPGVNSEHIGNHYGTTSLNNTIISVATRYTSAIPGQMLEINDMSLEEGGIFDISNNWFTPHRSHRFGEDVDIRIVPRQHRAILRRILKSSNLPFSKIIDEGNHWHLRL